MSNTKKKSGLGAESYFQNIPTLDAIEPPVAELETSKEVKERNKVRRTYALYEETQIALEELKLAARKQGKQVTLGDLLEEAVQLLIEKNRNDKGVDE
jgi:hypothetical protein